jgi:glycyl-tRNA synthetase
VTVDHQSLEDEAVTVRDRDTWEQERVKVAELAEHLQRRLKPEPLPTGASALEI